MGCHGRLIVRRTLNLEAFHTMHRDALAAPEIPQSIDELTPTWLTAALRASGHLGAGQVVSRDPQVLGEGEGFVGQIVRLTLGYSPDARSVDGKTPVPGSLIAKLPIRLAQNRQLGEALGAYEREIRFYDELAGEVPIAKPACFHAAMDPNPFAGREKEILEFLDRLPRFLVRLLLPLGMWAAARSRRRYLLLLEDLAPSGRVGDQVAGCSPDEAEAVVRSIAAVHAAWWQRPALEAMGWVAPVWSLSRYAEAMYRKGRVAFFETFGEGRSTRFREFADWLGSSGGPLMRKLAASPWTLVHGDYRLDNLFLSGQGRDARVMAFDWQNVCRGPGALDVAYFISGNLAPELAAEHDMRLLRVYHDTLVEAGVSDYGFDDCLRDYELSLLFVGYRMIAGMHLLDLTNARGRALVDGWLDRIDPLLPPGYAERVPT